MKIINKLLMGALLLTPLTGHSTPQLGQVCDIKIQMPDDTTNYFWDEGCKTVYVLPPQQGKNEIIDFTESADLSNPDGLCGQVKATEKGIKDHTATRNRYEEMIVEKEALKAKAMADEDQGRIDQLNLEIMDLIEKSENFKRNKFDLIEHMVEKALNILGREGGHTAFILKVNHQALVNKVAELNKGVNVNFRPMLLAGGGYTFGEKAENSSAVLPAVSAVDAPGIAPFIFSTAGLPRAKFEKILDESEGSKKEKADNIDESASESYENDGLTNSMGVNEVYPSSVNASIIWTAAPACRIYEKAQTSGDYNYKGAVAVNSVYKYHVLSKYGYTIKFSYEKFHKIVKKSKSKGGFFSKKVVNSVVNKLFADEVLEIKFLAGPDVRAQIPKAEMNQIKDDAKDRFIKWVLYYETNGKIKPAQLLDMPTGPNGSQVLGDALLKCPHLYCQIGGYGFKVLGSIFGRTASNSTSIDHKKLNQEWVVSKEKPLVYYGGMGFEN